MKKDPVMKPKRIGYWVATAHDGRQEPYKQAAGGERLVQYGDKGRMELTNGTVTNGPLATKRIRGQMQIGESTFQAKDQDQAA